MTNNEQSEDYEAEIWHVVDSVRTQAVEVITAHPYEVAEIEVQLPADSSVKTAVLQRISSVKNPTTGAIHTLQIDPNSGKCVITPPRAA